MKKIILVAGGTGNLGEKIIKALLERGAEVRMLARSGSDVSKLEKLEQLGVKVSKVDLFDLGEVTRACQGVSCIISALAGLRDVIVDTQTVLLEAAIAAGVPRFIPSDYSLDFTALPIGENRNFDVRREFHERLDKAPVSATSIFNGAFADILSYNIPVFNIKKKMVGYWGDNIDWHLDFTTMDNTAAFTAAAALDSSTPRYLTIAGFQVSPKELSVIGSEATKSAFNLVCMGSIDALAESNKRERAAHPEGENELYPKWQSGQYMHSMFSVHGETLNNDRYTDVKWTSATQFINSIL